MPSFPEKIFKIASALLLSVLFQTAHAEELYLEPVVQGYVVNQVVPAFDKNGKVYIEPEALASALKFGRTAVKNGLEIKYADTTVKIDFPALPKGEYLRFKGKDYLSLGSYQKLLGLELTYVPLEMQLSVESPRELPVVSRLKTLRRRENIMPVPTYDSFADYQFDNRYLSSPVIDVTLRGNYNVSGYGRADKRTYKSGYYEIDGGMLAGGFDVYASFFKDSGDKDAPHARITAGRTFLDEPENALNLVDFQAGDVTGFSSTLFNNSGNGRGVHASSFKDLVLSADKTIDISGPVSAGWEVELYLNDQLIGFRQSGVNGRYSFANIPVGFGLNTFKLVFYGPYGEIQTEERQYYSGTSPVKAGEFGYTFDAYQKDRYLLENENARNNDTDKAIVDFTGYYGIDDSTTFIAGLTQTPDPLDGRTSRFGTLGVQYIWGGASVQYNALLDLENQNYGHHFDIQGDVKIGTILARYDYYGTMKAPVSLYNGEFMKDVAELRLSGFVPYSRVPYFLSYTVRHGENGGDYQEIDARLSPDFMEHYNLSLENVFTKTPAGHNDYVQLLFQAQFGNLGLNTRLKYNAAPQTYFQGISQQVDYRLDKNTYFQFNWEHDYRSKYSPLSDTDVFSVNAARQFSFGGLSLTMSLDTDRNASLSLTYNVSFGKVPEKNELFTDATGAMSKRSAIYAKVVDDAGSPVAADKNGEALISDLEPYQKVVLNVDTTDTNDISLVPEFEDKKLVLRPGTVLPMTVRINRRGGLEGYLKGTENPHDFKVVLQDGKGVEAASKTPEADGSFIFDDLKFGTYELIVLNKEGKVTHRQKVILDKPFLSLSESIEV